jgi:cell division protein ZapA
MPHVEILIGGRSFEVACQEGEEPYLAAAAAMLDTEAQALSSQIGRMPEGRMLLMAGLMLADKTAGLEERLREAEAVIAALQAEAAAPAALSPEALAAMEEVAAQAEWLAERVAAKAAG